MQYKTIIIDDESKLREVLQIKVEQYCPHLDIVGTAASAEEGLKLIKELSPDIVFLDISMPGETGFDMLEKIDHPEFALIFVTGYSEYVLDAIKVSALDYLLKPVNTQELIEAVVKATEKIDKKNRMDQYELLIHNLNHVGDQNSRIAVPTQNSYEFVIVKDIVRLEGWQKYTKIWMTSGECLVSSYSLGFYKDMLEKYGFYETHKSHVINTVHIKRYLKEGTVIMSDNISVPVSRRKKDTFLDEIIKK